MELKYLAEMEKHGLSQSDLPEDAQVGIDEIEKVLRAMKMLEGKGQSIKPATKKKLKTMDKWVYYEILDHLHDTDKNDDEMEIDSDEVIEEIEEQIDNNNENEEDNSVGGKIDKELSKMHSTGKGNWNIDEIKSKAPNSYDTIFDAYADGEENGISTSNFELIETGEQVYTLTKK